MQTTEDPRNFKPTEEMIIFIAEKLEDGELNASVARALNAKPNQLNRFLRETDDQKIIEAKKIRENIRQGRRKTDPATNLESLEAQSMELFGVGLDARSDENVIWMRRNDFTTRMRLSTERKRSGRRPRGRSR